MGRDHYSALFASSPVDSGAARAVSHGVHYTPPDSDNQHSWAECPPLAQLAKDEENLAGRRFGYMTVIGKCRDRGQANHPIWVCRCVCGNFEGRSHRAILRADPSNKCSACRRTETLRKRASHPHLLGQSAAREPARLIRPEPAPEPAAPDPPPQPPNQGIELALQIWERKRRHDPT